MLRIAVVLLAVAVSDVAAGDCTSCKLNVTSCAIFKGYLDCLETHSNKPCTLATDDATKVKDAVICDAEAGHKDSACKCQEDFWSSARTDDTTRCKGYDTLMGCMAVKTGNDCGGSTKQAFAAIVKGIRDGNNNCPNLTATCKCERTAAIANASTDAKICSLVAAELTCLKDIAASDVSCTAGTLQSAVNTAVTEWQTTKKCLADSGAAENVFTATSLVLALISTFIL